MEAFHSPFPYGFPTMCGTTNPSSSSPIATPWMDTRIWSRLPQRLIDRVIACLPPPAFFRARLVCKRWYALLFSTTFLQLYLQIPHHCHWFIFFKHKTLKTYIYRNGSDRAIHEGFLFDPYNLKWYRLSFPLIPAGFFPANSSGGLISWVSEEAGSKNVILSNPLVGSLIPIPPTLRPRLFPSIGLNIANSSIDLVVAGDDLTSPYAVKNLTTESFHVDANGFYSIWGTTSSLPRLCSFESETRDGM
nr:protein UNUSUAL FLORAL ORGANS [Ipomoea batatas]